MLKIFNDLKPFFRDSYTRINVRAYARIRKISPPSASDLLNRLHKEGLLIQQKEKNYIYYTINRENRLFIGLSRAYWLLELERSNLIAHLEKELISPLIVLFGSFSKAEITKTSDIDLAVFTPSKKTISIEQFEKKLKRKIHIFTFASQNEAPKELLKNILNGLVIRGSW